MAIEDIIYKNINGYTYLLFVILQPFIPLKVMGVILFFLPESKKIGNVDIFFILFHLGYESNFEIFSIVILITSHYLKSNEEVPFVTASYISSYISYYMVI